MFSLDSLTVILHPFSPVLDHVLIFVTEIYSYNHELILELCINDFLVLETDDFVVFHRSYLSFMIETTLSTISLSLHVDNLLKRIKKTGIRKRCLMRSYN